jgi:hypothetical protein
MITVVVVLGIAAALAWVPARDALTPRLQERKRQRAQAARLAEYSASRHRGRT